MQPLLSFYAGDSGEPTGELKSAIDSAFGSYENFKKEFSTAGATQFGSGWAWLVKDGGSLKITKTPNAETPLHNGQVLLQPLLLFGNHVSWCCLLFAAAGRSLPHSDFARYVLPFNAIHTFAAAAYTDMLLPS